MTQLKEAPREAAAPLEEPHNPPELGEPGNDGSIRLLLTVLVLAGLMLAVLVSLGLFTGSVPMPGLVGADATLEVPSV